MTHISLMAQVYELGKIILYGNSNGKYIYIMGNLGPAGRS